MLLTTITLGVILATNQSRKAPKTSRTTSLPLLRESQAIRKDRFNSVVLEVVAQLEDD